MIKLIKKGFSLAELLIVMAIIAIVTAMSFTIAKKGIQDAYNLFLYTGYQGMYDAIGDAVDYGYQITNTGVNTCDFTKHIVKILSGTEESSSSTSIKFAVPNGIKYTLSYAGAYTYNSEQGYYYKIVMEVPHQKKSSSDSGAKITFYYFPTYNNGILIPDSVSSADNLINLQSRRDLLPFYVDDGTVGRVIEYSGGYGYEKPAFYDFKNAYCKAYGTLTLASKTFVNCSGIAQSTKGVVKPVNPRKIF